MDTLYELGFPLLKPLKKLSHTANSIFSLLSHIAAHKKTTSFFTLFLFSSSLSFYFLPHNINSKTFVSNNLSTTQPSTNQHLPSAKTRWLYHPTTIQQLKATFQQPQTTIKSSSSSLLLRVKPHYKPSPLIFMQPHPRPFLFSILRGCTHSTTTKKNQPKLT